MTPWSIFTYSFNWENIIAEPSAISVIRSGNLKFQFTAWETSPKGVKWEREEQWIDNLAKHLLNSVLQVLSDISVLVGETSSQVCDSGNVNWSTEQTENGMRQGMMYSSSKCHAHLWNHSMKLLYIFHFIIVTLRAGIAGSRVLFSLHSVCVHVFMCVHTK